MGGGGRHLRQLLEEVNTANAQEFGSVSHSAEDGQQSRPLVPVMQPMPQATSMANTGPRRHSPPSDMLRQPLDEAALRRAREQRLQQKGEEERKARLRQQDRFRAVQRRLRAVGDAMAQHQAVVVHGIPSMICDRQLFGVVLEQAGLWGENVAGFELYPGAGQQQPFAAIITFRSLQMAHNCVEHFSACRWHAEGHFLPTAYLAAPGTERMFWRSPSQGCGAVSSSWQPERGGGGGRAVAPARASGAAAGSAVVPRASQDGGAKEPTDLQSLSQELEAAMAEHTELILEALLSPSEFEVAPLLPAKRVPLGPPGFETPESAVLAGKAGNHDFDVKAEEEQEALEAECAASASAAEPEDDRSTRSGSSQSAETL
eukprot:TRINITY_DN121129_c0_g1_i1.p1 TRINITY_DN121129_c0_g1~~TRINITY_DN121129_c0_g1_i1.p1  ORF type:complete len:373 (+),score=106.90 TRINITY_DN121129_c0_g1_i1:122-1240(+)